MQSLDSSELIDILIKRSDHRDHVPMIGMIQWISGRADQPNQNRQMGIQKAPTNVGGNRFSGCISPFSSNCGSSLYLRYRKKGGITTKAPTSMPIKESPS